MEAPSATIARDRDDAARAFEVSVVMPAYQASRWIGAALASIRAQTLAPAEVIVVDDGSTDGTAEIAEKAGATVLRRPNAGAGAARNAGIARASSPWIAFCDADDLWRPTFLERSAEAVRCCPAIAFCFADGDQFDDDGVIVDRVTGDDPAYRALQGAAAGPGIVRHDGDLLGAALYRSEFIMPSSVVVRRQALDRAGWFDEALRICEDYDLFLRLARGATVAAIEEPLIRLRKHETNLSRDALENTRWHRLFWERIAAAPWRYPAGAELFLRADRLKRAYVSSRYALYHGLFATAREQLAELIRLRPSASARTFYVLAALADNPAGRALHRVALHLWEERKRTVRRHRSTLRARARAA